MVQIGGLVLYSIPTIMEYILIVQILLYVKTYKNYNILGIYLCIIWVAEQKWKGLSMYKKIPVILIQIKGSTDKHSSMKHDLWDLISALGVSEECLVWKSSSIFLCFLWHFKLFSSSKQRVRKLSHSAENELPKIAKYSISDESAIIFNKTTHASTTVAWFFSN